MATTSTQITSDVPEFLRPFYVGGQDPTTKQNIEGLLSRGISAIYPGNLTGPDAYKSLYYPLIDEGLQGSGGIAGMSQYQQMVGERLQGLQLPNQFGLGTQAAQQAAAGYGGLQDLQAMGVYGPELATYQMQGPQQVSGQQVTANQFNAAQTQFNPDLQRFQMQGPQAFGSEQAQQYMSPYMQNVVDVQQRQAIEAAQKSQLDQNLASARQGTYGGARQALLQGERESGLRTQLGDIQASGSQRAFEQAQQQFERDRAAQMGVGSQNLQAALGVQQLGTQTGLQTALANLTADQQTRVQNAANQLQASGMSAEQAMRAALANQQTGFSTNQANLQSALGVQQLGAGQNLEAQRANQAAALQAAQLRLGATQGLGSLAGTLGQMGTQQLAGELDMTKMLGAYGDLQRGINQQQLDAQRQYLTDQSLYGQQQVGMLSNLLRGIPMTNQTQTQTTPPPSFASQLTGMGVTGLGLFNMLGGK
jgi:hypothetical protein